MILTIGRRHKVEVATLREASQVFSRLRDQSGEGSSTWPDGTVKGRDGTFHISYNGRIWEGPKANRTPITDPAVLNRTEA